MVPVIGVGAGGHTKVLLDILRSWPDFNVIGLLDADAMHVGQFVLGCPILGDDSLLPQLAREQCGLVFFLGVGSVAATTKRRRIWERTTATGIPPISRIVAPSAVVSPAAILGRGTVVLPGAIVNAGAQLGENVIVNSRAVVEHDCAVGDHTHIATGACLSGGVRVGSDSLIGAGSVVRQYISIGNNAVVGAGACAVRDVPDGSVVVGVPARALQK
jgi:UDP-perosamine 4-acetyltransferase